MRVITCMIVGVVVVGVMAAGGCGGVEEAAGEGGVRQAVYVSTEGGEEGGVIHVYRVDTESGALAERQRVALPGAVGSLAVSPDGRLMYASIRSEQAVATLAVDGATGELELLDVEPVGTNAVYLNVDATGRHLLTADYGAGTAAVYAIGEDGLVVGEARQVVETDRHAHAVVFDADERFVFVPHTGPSAIYRFSFDAAEGVLEANDPPYVTVAGGAGPRHMRFHPRLEDRAYSVNELDSSVTVFAYDAEAGGLEAIQNLPTLPEEFEGENTCAEIHLTPDGRFLYASNRGHDTIAVYAVDGESGELRFVERAETEARPRGFAIDAEGRFLYAAGKNSNRVAAFSIDPQTGQLERLAETHETAERPNWVHRLVLD